MHRIGRTFCTINVDVEKNNETNSSTCTMTNINFGLFLSVPMAFGYWLRFVRSDSGSFSPSAGMETHLPSISIYVGTFQMLSHMKINYSE